MYKQKPNDGFTLVVKVVNLIDNCANSSEEILVPRKMRNYLSKRFNCNLARDELMLCCERW